MTKHFKPVRVSEHVYWVGAIDWGIRDFHGYTTSRGTTYNAYLIMADKITLIDAVKAPFRDELLGRIASLINPKDIAYIISNHSEMDHTGCLPEIINAVQPEKVLASALGVKALREHFGNDMQIQEVKDGEKLNIGNLNLQFFETRMLHWPDSMLTYLVEDELLFSQDGFGMHLASSERFADELDTSILRQEAVAYFANILMPFAKIVNTNIDKLNNAGISIRIIAPDHGPIWRENPMSIIELYSRWANKAPSNKAVVAYGTMWHSTGMMARAICEGLTAGGAKYELMPLNVTHRSDIATHMLDASALLVGSSTLNNQMLPQVADVMTYLKGLKPTGLIGAAFGSYGWSGEAPGQLEDILKSMKVDLICDPIKVKYVPTDEDLARCCELGELVAAKLRENIRD